MLSLILNTNLIKRKSKTDYPQDTTWDHLEWVPAVITATLCPSTDGKSLQVLYTHPQSFGITLATFDFPEAVLVFLNSTRNTQSSFNPQKKQKPITISLIINKHYTHTKLGDVDCGRSMGKLSNPWGSKRKSWTHLPCSFHLIKTRKRKIKL